MAIFDASSMIYAWDNYPIKQFPPLWNWMAAQVDGKAIVMPQVAFKPVMDKQPDCGIWLKKNNIEIININNDIVQQAFKIKVLLGINNDEYTSDGVDEDDILIIASSKIYIEVLVSNESKQPNIPNNKKNMKIPAVCGFNDVRVKCLSFLEFIKNSGEIFG